MFLSETRKKSNSFDCTRGEKTIKIVYINDATTFVAAPACLLQVNPFAEQRDGKENIVGGIEHGNGML